MENTPAGRTYVRTLAFWMVVYIALVVALSSARKAELLAAPWSYAAAWTPSIPIAGVMWAVWRFMQGSDEFVRALTAKRLVIALALTQVLCSAWGFMEIYATASHLPLYIVFPIFWASYGVITPLVRSSS